MPDERERVLAQFQRRSSEIAETQRGDDQQYHAYKAVNRKQLTLLVQPAGKSCEWVTYQYLLRVVLDDRQTRLALIFSFMAISLKGRNLRQVAEAVAERHCDFIREFDPKQWKKPDDQEAAFVESIEFITSAAPMSAAREVA